MGLQLGLCWRLEITAATVTWRIHFGTHYFQQDPDFPRLSGARVVRIAVHPELSGAGYGTRCVEVLRRYYQGEITGAFMIPLLLKK